MHLIKLLMYAFSNRKTIHKVIEEEKEKQEQLSQENLRTKLDLCEKHQPKNPGAIYDELNCSHCALEKNIRYLEKANITDKKQATTKTEKSMLEH